MPKLETLLIAEADLKSFVAGLVAILILIPNLAWSTQSAKVTSTPKLSDYILSAEAVASLKEEDKMAYFVFLYHYVSFFEHAQIKAVAIKPSDKSALNDFLEYLNLDFNIPGIEFSFLPEAHAALPVLIPLAVGAARLAPIAARTAPLMGRTIITYSTKASIWARAWAASKGPLMWSSLGYGATELSRPSEAKNQAPTPPPRQVIAAAKPGSAVRKTSVTKTTANGAGRVGRRAGGAAAAGSGMASAGEASEGAASEGDNANEGASGEAVGGYKSEGSSCIFGGHNSKYIAKGNGLTCSKPQVDTSGCVVDGKAFKCETFGMLAGPTAADNVSTGCVPLQPLENLTVRCTEKLTAWLSTNPPPLLDTKAYTAWRAEVTKHIDEFEANFGAGVKFSDYCKDANAVNEGRQADECEALTTLFAQVKSFAPKVTQTVAQNATAAPAKPNPDVIAPALGDASAKTSTPSSKTAAPSTTNLPASKKTATPKETTSPSAK